MKIRIIRDVRFEHNGREFIHVHGQELDSSDHSAAERFAELLNSGAAEPIAEKIETAAVRPAKRAK
jgi:hypothetical protein